MLIYASKACHEHSNFFKVKCWVIYAPSEGHIASPSGWRRDPSGTSPIFRNSTTSFLTAATLRYTLGVGITAAAGTKLALQLNTQCLNVFGCVGENFTRNKFPVTTFQNLDWVIYAPAAYRSCGSHFSGSLSGVKPQFSVPVTALFHPYWNN